MKILQRSLSSNRFGSVNLLAVVNDQVPKVVRIHVFAQEVQEKPVSCIELTKEMLQSKLINEPASRSNCKDSEIGKQTSWDSIDDCDERGDCQEIEPKPQEDIDLLIDNVNRKYAHGIVSLQVSWRSVSMKGTFGQSREDSNHGIVSNWPIPFCEQKDLPSVVWKLASQKSIHDVHLKNDIEEVQKFRQRVYDERNQVSSSISCKIFDKKLLICRLVLFIHDWVVESKDEVSNLPSFKRLPKISGDIEQQGLEKEDETNPLVVCMIYSLVFLIIVSVFHRIITVLVDSRIRDFTTHFLEPTRLNGEGRVNPTVSVE